LASKGFWSGEIWNRRKDGQVYAELVTISAVCDDNGDVKHYVALFTDITPLKDHQRQLEHVAHYDTLTGLPNRVLLADRLKQAMAHAQRRGQFLAVAFLDLDGFKAVNDAYGHTMGDALLNAIASRMKEALREEDSLSRFGGDEFVAVLVDLKLPADCEPVLRRLLQAVCAPLVLGTETLQVSASIGVTLYPQDGGDADLLIRHADQAMYLAKLAGKNRYQFFDVAHDIVTKTMREGLEQVRVGLERREFVLYYQPKVNMRTGLVIGAEALIRWQHPERGLLPPGLFLPIIEDHPMSIELGEWVISTALNQMGQWRLQGLDIFVSVNIGARQLQQEGFVDRLKAMLLKCPDVPAQFLELEILETSALEDISKVSSVIASCQALGVRFALDDFGTGYSSLTYLKHLPAEMLKIDQSFVRDMLNDTDDLAIVQGVIGLAKAFRRKVIAEGVETIAHGELLLPLGCELAQGYGIARPMPAVDIPAWVKNWRPDPSWSNTGNAITMVGEVQAF
jgi:diguanylate cyclase (GGDEF)-like protein